MFVVDTFNKKAIHWILHTNPGVIMNETKPWYQSKTVWANIIAAVSLIVNSQAQVVSQEEIASLTVLVNMILRFVTKQPLAVKSND
jgi:hypothetical protein